MYGCSERAASQTQNVNLSSLIILLEPQSRFGGKPLKLHVVCPQNGTAVLKALVEELPFFAARILSYCCCFFLPPLQRWGRSFPYRRLLQTGKILEKFTPVV